MWTVLGILLFLVGLLVAIAWHEAGHLAFAKLFKVRTSQYMVGFGKTLWSKRVGETEYGIKAIPLGGYVRMVGMVPPARSGRSRWLRGPSTTVTGPWAFFRQIAEDTRAADRAQVTEADVDRQFYQLHPFKRIVIMFAGPLQNLIFAVVIFAVIVLAIGIPTVVPTIGSVSQCVVPATATAATCGPDDPATPAAEAGLLPGDTIVAFDGRPIDSWQQLQDAIREAAGTTVPLTYVRDGSTTTVDIDIVENTLGVYDERGRLTGTRQGGFLGIQASQAYITHGIGDAFVMTGDFIARAAHAVVTIPARIPALWDATFAGGERQPDSPVGIVGAGRISGEILSLEDTSAKDKLLLFLQLLAGFNMSLFLLNMLPLLPLDGGHIFGAIIEWIRKGWAKVRRKADPGPFDVAALMPVAYVVVLLFVGLTLLTFIADIVNPVTLRS